MILKTVLIAVIIAMVIGIIHEMCMEVSRRRCAACEELPEDHRLRDFDHPFQRKP